MNRTYLAFLMPKNIIFTPQYFIGVSQTAVPLNEGNIAGEVAERLIVAVSKTVEGNTSGGSNPPLSAR